MNDFIIWLMAELDKRGWTYSELAQRASVSQSTISMLMSRHNQPGNELCLGIARAFKLPPEDVFRKAGILPPLPAPEDDITLKELYEYVKRLPPDERLLILDYATHRYERVQSRGERGAIGENDSASASGSAKAAA